MPLPLPFPLAVASSLLRPKPTNPSPNPSTPATSPTAPKDRPFWGLLSKVLDKAPGPTAPDEGPEVAADSADVSGAAMPRFPMVRIRRRPDGAHEAYDADGNTADVVGFDDMGAVDDVGAYEELSGIDDDLDDLGAACDDLGADLDSASGDDIGASLQSAERHIDEIDAKIAEARAHIATIRPPFKQAKINATNRKIAKLVGQRAKLKAQIRSAKREKAPHGVSEASRQGKNNRGGGSRQAIAPRDAARIAAAQARQGLRFDVGAAPPGSGRLVEVNMYASGSTTPRNVFVIPATPFINASVTLTTEDVPYERYRVVGFRNTVASTSGSTAQAYVATLQTKGSANLFANDNPSPAAQYMTDLQHLVGLREYPEVRSPNVCRVSVHAEGDASSEGDTVVYSAAVVAEVEYDDVFGPGSVGPYTG